MWNLEGSVRSRGTGGTTGYDRDLIEAGLNEAAGAEAYGFCAFRPLLKGSLTGPTAVPTGTG